MVNESLLAPLNSCCTTTLWQDQWQGRASWLLKVNSWISWICIHMGTSETKLDLFQRGTKLMYMNVISCWMYSSFHLWPRLVYLASCCSCWWRHLAWVPVVGQIKEESVKVGGDEQHPAKETSLYYLLPMPWTPFSTLLQTAGFFLDVRTLFDTLVASLASSLIFTHIVRSETEHILTRFFSSSKAFAIDCGNAATTLKITRKEVSAVYSGTVWFGLF